ncbi:MAG TPA: sigma-E factor regulatory protein RseB domain-containing protein [Bryobacteraceae bacterium]|nr:sigma-E factor regulatory protein RseB domain-containing protein [Candidatus Acidoferrales bacterium]
MSRMYNKQIVAVSVAGLLLVAPRAWCQTQESLPRAEDIVAKMTARNAEMREAFSGYAVLRRYEVVNKHHHAEMLVRLVCAPDGGKQFSILREAGSHFIRKHVFRKMLRKEEDASTGEMHDNTRIIPANYFFEMVGTDRVDGRPAYVLAIKPKRKSKYLIRGLIWVDAADYAITRVEGHPAKNPSFWTKSVHVVRTYDKIGKFWVPASTRSVTEVWIFGSARLSIHDFDYAIEPQIEARVRP